MSCDAMCVVCSMCAFRGLLCRCDVYDVFDGCRDASGDWFWSVSCMRCDAISYDVVRVM